MKKLFSLYLLKQTTNPNAAQYNLELDNLS